MVDCSENVKQKIANKYNHAMNTERSMPQLSSRGMYKPMLGESKSLNELPGTFNPKRRSVAMPV